MANYIETRRFVKPVSATLLAISLLALTPRVASAQEAVTFLPDVDCANGVRKQHVETRIAAGSVLMSPIMDVEVGDGGFSAVKVKPPFPPLDPVTRTHVQTAIEAPRRHYTITLEPNSDKPDDGKAVYEAICHDLLVENP